jgi:hypothetical protein
MPDPSPPKDLPPLDIESVHRLQSRLPPDAFRTHLKKLTDLFSEFWSHPVIGVQT